MNLLFEKAQPDNIDQIYTFCKDLIEQYEDPEDVCIPDVLAWTQRKITKLISEYVRVVSDGKVVAYYHFSPEEGKMELDDLYVLSEYRGQGVGTAIIQKCCCETELPVFLYVFKENKPAVSLYEKMGFRMIKPIGKTRCIMQRDPEQNNSSGKE